MYAQIKDFKNAEKWLKKALKEKNNDWGIYLNLMNFYTSQLNYVQAKKYGRILREKIKVEPKSFFKTPWGQFVQNNISEVLKKK
jgi:tetratricopeptide (TPR) repeat protein